MNTLIAVLLCLFFLAIFAAVAVSYAIFKYAVVRRKKSVSVWDSDNTFKVGSKFERYGSAAGEGARWILSMNPEEVFIDSHDSLKLSAHIVWRPSACGIFLMCHGFRSSPLNDFSGIAKKIYDEGFTLVLIDQRAHGNSGGKYITYGDRERFDVKLWTEYLEERYGDLPIILYGISMGASTVLGSSSLNLPNGVRGVIADCGYTSAEDICVRVLKNRFHLPKFPFYYISRGIAMFFASVDLSSFKVGDALRENRLPVLFIHGKKDFFVPYDMSAQNIKSCLFCESFLFSSENAGHGLSYMEDMDGYMNAVLDFLRFCGIE